MVQYHCIKCDKIFNQKGHYNYHINRKRPCESKEKEKNIESKMNPIESKMNPIESENTKFKKYICAYCNSSFSTNSNMSKHIKICKTKKRQDDQKEDLLQKLIEKMAIIEQEMKKKDEEIKKVANLETELQKLKSENKKYVKKIGKQQNNNINTQNNIEN